MKCTLDIHGVKLRCASNRRYITVAYRTTPITTVAGTYVAYAIIIKRSDDPDVCWKAAHNYSPGPLAKVGVWDTLVKAEI